MASSPQDHRARLAALARHIPAFVDPAFPVGVWCPQDAPPGCFSPASFLLNAETERFVADCYAHGWVLAGFDWAAWAQSPEAQTLRDEPTALARADEQQLARLLTVAIRQERFVEGALAAAFASGLILGILRRADALNDAAGRRDG